MFIHFHEPCRLHPDRDRFLWDELNRDVFLSRLEQVYLPAIDILAECLHRFPFFRFTMGMSGTFLEQAQTYGPQLIDACRELCRLGLADHRVEFADETYYYSTAGLFRDVEKREFRDQVALHREQLRALFGIYPVIFAFPEVVLTGEVARIVAEMDYRVLMAEPAVGRPHRYRIPGHNLCVQSLTRVLPGDTESAVGEDGSIAFYDLSQIYGVQDFRQALMTMIEKAEGTAFFEPITMSMDGDVDHCPEGGGPPVDVKELFNAVQYALFCEIEEMESAARMGGKELLTRWRYLTMWDHFRYLKDREVPGHPYGGSAALAAYILTHKIDRLKMDLLRFEILKRAVRTAVFMISPETGRLPDGMGRLARFISGKSGGQGEVVAALCKGLVDRGIDVHLATLNLKKRFQRENQLGEEEWRAIRYTIPPDRIHLISSPLFADKMNAYEGDVLSTAMEFQRQLVNYVIKDVRAQHEGRLIVHSHDWMAGGAVTAYARARDLPILHTVHNVFTAYIPLSMMSGIDIKELYEYLFLTFDQGNLCMDCQATAIKNATLINFVGQRFLEEVVNDYFLDRPIIPPGVRQEVKAKYANHAVHAIMNAPSPDMYPENCEYLVRRFGPDDEIIRAKRENLLAFQKLTGLIEDPAAILLFWPSRLDPTQKGVELLEAIAQPFCDAHPDVQIAIIADGVGNDRTHQEILGRIAYASGGRIAYYHYAERLSMLGYGAANDVFGTSLYEPCGQIDQVANLFGATATNRDTGGYHDKITELQLKIDGATQDTGNGFLFRDYDPGGLWYGLEKSVSFHRHPPETREPQLRRIMKEARVRYDLNNMIAAYIRLYESLNNNKPLV